MTYPYPKGEHMGAVGALICEFFFKNTVFSIVLTFVDDFTLKSDNNKEIWSFGLCWPLLAFLAFMALDDFLEQKMAFADKN